MAVEPPRPNFGRDGDGKSSKVTGCNSVSSAATSSKANLEEINDGLELEDYLMELEKRLPHNENGDEGKWQTLRREEVEYDKVTSESNYGIMDGNIDFRILLQQKERDLVLAAELGKALLEKNEELQRRLAVLNKDYSARLEELEAERHSLKRRLEAIEGEYDGRLAELNSDLLQAQQELHHKELLFRELDEERSRLVVELQEQNLRLTTQLANAQATEGQLVSELEKLRDQWNTRRGNQSEQSRQLQLLRTEMLVLHNKCTELERRLSSISRERDSLLHALEEANETVSALESRSRDQEYSMLLKERDLIELRRSNSRLEDQMEELRSAAASSSPPSHNLSLLNELEAAQSDNGDCSGVQSVAGSASDLLPDMKTSLLPRSSQDNEQDVEAEDDEDEAPASLTHKIARDYQLSQQLWSTYEQLQELCKKLTSQSASHDADNSNASPVNEDQATIRPMIEELKIALRDIARRQNESEIAARLQAESLARDLQLEQELNRQLQEQLHSQQSRSQQCEHEIESLTAQMNLKETELLAVRAENVRLREEQALQESNQDEVVKRAREDRDQAISRQNTLELELTKTRTDIRCLNNQLMEAVAQKIELSQQLEAWQVDMQSVLNDQLKDQLRQEEQRRRKHREELAEQKMKSKKFALWR